MFFLNKRSNFENKPHELSYNSNNKNKEPRSQAIKLAMQCLIF